MKQTFLNKIAAIWRGKATIMPAVAILGGASLFAVNARAACSVPSGPRAQNFLPPDQEEQAPTKHSSEVGSESTAHQGRPAITGLWFVNLYSGGVLFDQGFDVWHSDGTEILNDNAPPEPAWSTGAFCMGVWKQTDHNTYKLRHLGWNFDGNGNLSAKVLLLETITINDDADRYWGTFELDSYDPISKKLISQTTGELKAHRITVD